MCAPWNRRCTIPARPRRLLRSGPAVAPPRFSPLHRRSRAPLTAEVQPRPQVTPNQLPAPAKPRPARAAPGGGGGVPQSPSRPTGAQSRRSLAANQAGKDREGVCGSYGASNRVQGQDSPPPTQCPPSPFPNTGVGSWRRLWETAEGSSSRHMDILERGSRLSRGACRRACGRSSSYSPP